jgi:hypothetical protein
MVKTKSKKTKISAKTWRDKLLTAIKVTALSFIVLFYLPPWLLDIRDGQAVAYYSFLLAMIWALFIMGGVYIGARVLASPKRKK